MTRDSANGRSIRIFLRDGDPSGTRTAEITMSTTQAIAFRRRQLRKLGNELQEMIERPGAYILMGGGDEKDGREAYIGESEDVFSRLTTHNSASGKEFWEDTIVLVSKDANVTKSHARYVESLLLADAGDNRHWTLPNRQNPSKTAGRLPAPDRVDMCRFVAEAKILVGVLGCDIFRADRVNTAESATSQGDIDSGRSAVSFGFGGKEYDASMRLSDDDRFIVEAGSKARKVLTPTAPAAVRNLRDSLVGTGDLREQDGSLVFASDCIFSSVSAAAGVVSGASVNGRTAWKNDAGQTYGEWEAAEGDPR